MIRAVLLSAVLLSPMPEAMARQVSPDDASPGPMRADPPRGGVAQPMVVTSDTGAYCQSLSRQIDRHGTSLPQPVASLRDQGQQLCATGQVRGGINRLRRALLALHDPGDADTDADGEIKR